MADATSVTISGLTKSFRAGRSAPVTVLRGVDLFVEESESLVLLGPSGCGKTTLLRCLAGLERPDGGSIQFGGVTQVNVPEGRFVPTNRRDIGMVFQAYVLWPHMTVGQNVAYPLKARRHPADKERRVAEVLDLVQCGHLADRRPGQLSGGQQQRIGLARALAAHPRLLLLDEPLSNLDAALRLDLRNQLRELHRTVGYTAIHVTHDQEEALALGTRIALMREGRIEQVGPPEVLYRTPASPYAAQFLGARNFTRIKVDARTARTSAGEVSGLPSLPGAAAVRAYARPTQLRLVDPARDTVDRAQVVFHGARVVDRSFSGSAHVLVVMVGDDQWTVSISGVAPDARPGDTVAVACAPGDLFLFDENDEAPLVPA